MEEVTEVTEDKDLRCGPARGRYRVDEANSPLGEKVRRWILAHNIERLHGPETIDYETDELVVLVGVRNGRPYVRQFIEHYFSLGAKHIVFLDNGSTDGTVEAIKGYDNVTALRAELPYKYYNIPVKRYLVERFGQGRWTLSVDMDELFDYPYSDVINLKTFLGYLNANSYTAVVCHMLDLFSDEPLSADKKLVDAPLKETHRFYDLSDVKTLNYHNNLGDIGNVLANEEIKVLKGGSQSRVFGIDPLLTKHPLVFLDGALKPMDLSDHWSGNARVADFTGVLLHYKILDNIYEVTRMEMEERRYFKPGKYDSFSEVLQKSPTISVKTAASRKLQSVNELVGTRFVSMSEQYLKFVEDEERRQGSYSAEVWKERLARSFSNARAEMIASDRTVDELRGRLAALRQNKGVMEQRNLLERAERAELRIQAIQSSRTWRLLTLLSIAKNKILGVLRNFEKKMRERK